MNYEMSKLYRQQFQSMPEWEGFSNFFTFTVWHDIKNDRRNWERWQKEIEDLRKSDVIRINGESEMLPQLASRLENHYKIRNNPAENPRHNLGVYSTLIVNVLNWVNWREIATELLEAH